MKKNKAGKGNREGPCDERRPPWENKICTEICTRCSSVNCVYILGNNMPGIEFSKFGGPETGACLMFWGTKEASVARDELSNRRSGLWRSHKGRQGLRSRGALFSAKQEAAGHFWVGEWHNLTSIKKKKIPLHDCIGQDLQYVVEQNWWKHTLTLFPVLKRRDSVFLST